MIRKSDCDEWLGIRVYGEIKLGLREDFRIAWFDNVSESNVTEIDVSRKDVSHSFHVTIHMFHYNVAEFEQFTVVLGYTVRALKYCVIVEFEQSVVILCDPQLITFP